MFFRTQSHFSYFYFVEKVLCINDVLYCTYKEIIDDWKEHFLATYINLAVHTACTIGELDCTAPGELFDWDRPFLPWLLTTGECEMTWLKQWT